MPSLRAWASGSALGRPTRKRDALRAHCPPLDQSPIPLHTACRYVRRIARRLITGFELVDHYATHFAHWPMRWARSARPHCTLIAGASTARAQDIEPRAYSNAPIGVNFLISGYVYTRGGLAFDASLPVQDPNLETSSAVLAYARTLDLWGKSGKFDAIVPYTWLSGTARAVSTGETIQREVDGLADSRFRLSVNLYGAPALTLNEFRDYQQDLIVGVSLQVSVPTGQYDPSKLVNIGTNRWSFKPEVGVSKAVGPWTLEFSAAVTLYTDNTDFLGGNTRSQDSVYSMQGHAIYGFRPGVWASVGCHLFHRRPHDDQRLAEQRSSTELAVGRHAGVSRGCPQLHQALREQRSVRTDRKRLRSDGSCLAVSLGRRTLMYDQRSRADCWPRPVLPIA